MAVNLTPAERQKRAAEDLARKLNLEVFLKADMWRLFGKISSAARLLFAASGLTLDVMQYRDDLQKILEKHYKRVFRAFQDPLRADMDDAFGMKKAKSAISDALDEENQSYVDDESHSHAVIILLTAQNRLEQSISKAKLDYHQSIGSPSAAAQSQSPAAAQPETSAQRAEEAQDLTGSGQDNNDAIAAGLAANFDAGNDASANLIAITETQQAAETAKQNAVTAAIAGFINGGDIAGGMLLASTAAKEWSTILDGRERPWHREANGQIQPINTPFVVNGEELKYPGDTSLGATINNIANCRCSAQYIFNLGE